jgi:hypothetical protein
MAPQTPVDQLLRERLRELGALGGNAWANKLSDRRTISEGQESRGHALGKKEGQVTMNANDVVAIIKRRQAKFQAQHRAGPQEHMDDGTRTIAEEYDSLLAEIETATASQPEAERKNQIAEAEILGEQGQSGG